VTCCKDEESAAFTVVTVTATAVSVERKCMLLTSV